MTAIAVGQQEKQEMEAQAEVAAQQAMVVLNAVVGGRAGVDENRATKRRGNGLAATLLCQRDAQSG